MTSRNFRGLLSRSVPGLKISLRSSFNKLLSQVEQTKIDNACLRGELEQLKGRHTDAVQNLTIENARLAEDIKALDADRARLTLTLAHETGQFQQRLEAQESRLKAQESENRRLVQN